MAGKYTNTDIYCILLQMGSASAAEWALWGSSFHEIMMAGMIYTMRAESTSRRSTKCLKSLAYQHCDINNEEYVEQTAQILQESCSGRKTHHLLSYSENEADIGGSSMST
jgi:hypothetical protein